jgi:hypothetical protein
MVFGISVLDLETYAGTPDWCFRLAVWRQERRNARFRRWLAGVDDPVLRGAYEMWIAHAERRCVEVREELATGSRRRAYRERLRRSNEEVSRSVRLSRRLPQP